MSMTEHEAQCILIEHRPIIGFPKYSEALNMAMHALEEIQEYREIGTVEEIRSMKENGSFSGMELAQIAAIQMKLKEYQSIGTVEECRAAVKRMEPKKAITQSMISYCPTCKERLYSVAFNVGYCRCGQKLDLQ